MRKLIFIFACLCISMPVFAQLNIKNSSSKEERFYKDNWAQIVWNGNAFMFHSTDPETGMSLVFSLGSNREETITTLKDIQDWIDNTDKKSSITFEVDGMDITLYKPDNLQIIITTGDAVYAQKEYSQRLSGAVLGTAGYKRKEATPHFSFIQKKLLPNAIRTISELTDEKYNHVEDKSIISEE